MDIGKDLIRVWLWTALSVNQSWLSPTNSSPLLFVRENYHWNSPTTLWALVTRQTICFFALIYRAILDTIGREHQECHLLFPFASIHRSLLCWPKEEKFVDTWKSSWSTISHQMWWTLPHLSMSEKINLRVWQPFLDPWNCKESTKCLCT